MVGSCTVNTPPLYLVRAGGRQGPQKAAVDIPTQPEEWPVILARRATAQTSAPIRSSKKLTCVCVRTQSPQQPGAIRDHTSHSSCTGWMVAVHTQPYATEMQASFQPRATFLPEQFARSGGHSALNLRFCSGCLTILNTWAWHPHAIPGPALLTSGHILPCVSFPYRWQLPLAL